MLSFFLPGILYGLGNDLSLRSNIANFSDLFVYRIGGGPQSPRSALPIGADPMRLVPLKYQQGFAPSSPCCFICQRT